jgi:hypothetical protein
MARQNVSQFVRSSAVGLGKLKVEVTGRLRVAVMSRNPCRGVAKLVKASDFDSDMRGFESFLPCQNFC